ncbi:hypothetical protein COO91_02729 [Nostoc flagelliforme CCNUN1]|uniref:Uncharacterized protein n=1 Tax=Nostoc flagelliforme CCNUN1 TaxID=2038116 RepID=A0A2K8SMU9_9NOSO|nr:hypothetical protein COO91_02729 [Nostoc flagelliforme CCNUN1]
MGSGEWGVGEAGEAGEAGEDEGEMNSKLKNFCLLPPVSSS